MTGTEKALLQSIKEMERQAPEIGLCAQPFHILHSQVSEIIAEKEKLAAYRELKAVKKRSGYAGECPACGVVFLDPWTHYCGNCGQAITFNPKEQSNE